MEPSFSFLVWILVFQSTVFVPLFSDQRTLLCRLLSSPLNYMVFSYLFLYFSSVKDTDQIFSVLLMIFAKLESRAFSFPFEIWELPVCFLYAFRILYLRLHSHILMKIEWAQTRFFLGCWGEEREQCSLWSQLGNASQFHLKQCL